MTPFAACQPELNAADDTPTSAATTGFTQVPADALLRATENVNLRAGPSSTNAVLTVVEKGDSVTAVAGQAQGQWLGVSHRGVSGFVFLPYVTLDACLTLDTAAQHLKDAMAKCPGAGDENIYGFDRALCERASAPCSTAELDLLLAVATCDLETVPVCQSDADRQSVLDAVNACVERLQNNADSLSSQCMNALQP